MNTIKRALRILGFIFSITGIFLLLNSYTGISGFTVLDRIDKFVGSFMAFVLIFMGITFIIVSGRMENEAEARLHS